MFEPFHGIVNQSNNGLISLTTNYKTTGRIRSELIADQKNDRNLFEGLR